MQSETPRPPLSLQRKVLVIDDEPQVLRLVSRILASNQVDHETAESGDLGLEIVQSRPEDFELAIVDMTMPGISGKETIERLLDIRSELLVILSSGFSEEELADGFERDVLDGYIQKPYSPSQLIDCIRETLGGVG